MENARESFRFDLVIRSGRVIDPAHGMDEIVDIGVKGGKISHVTSHLEGRGHEEFDATGCIVTPGLIDSHVHVYQHATPLGVNPDKTCLSRGVTTVADAGSAGMQLIKSVEPDEEPVQVDGGLTTQTIKACFTEDNKIVP